MEPTATPDDGRHPAGAGPVPGQRRPGDDPRAAPGDETTTGPTAGDPDRQAGSALTNDTQMVPLGSRRPADALLGGTTNGLRWTDQGGFPPVEMNGHRDEFGPRHGGTSRANGQNPVANGSLPGARSPFAPPAAPETPPLYAPSPFASAGGPRTPELPADPLAPLDPPGARRSPEDDRDAAGRQDAREAAGRPDGRDGADRPDAGPPAATGSAQVPMPLDRPVSAQPAGDARTRPVSAQPAPPEHDAWAPPAHRPTTSGSASVPVGAGDDASLPAGSPPFPGFGVPPAEPGAAQPAGRGRPEQGDEPEEDRSAAWGRPDTTFRAGALPPNPLQPTPSQAPLPPNPLQPAPLQSALPPNPLQPAPLQSALPPNPLQPAPVQPLPPNPLQPGPVPGGRRSRTDEEPEARVPGRRAADPAEAPAADQGGARAATLGDVREGRRAADPDDTRTGRRAAGDEPGRRGRDEAPAGRRAAREDGGDGPLRPGDVRQESIAFWDEAASAQFRAEWHEVKAQFVDDPVAALTRAHALLTEAVQELGEAMLAERDRLDPLGDDAVPDTESMRMAMRGYREFLDRILSL
ncbi:hypothetical protein COUCH_29395 [Couchioplanes caeruleus]|uniref:hypothetical protein n=1 Tax=Couchioplanes caeruleus TaxID=56438 RepID=UPI0020C03A8D|nr:hypothetical protein [Couchioplanes caeruleus]UQU63108.1 hypothetical protein COUCH_29395 [Couchioplanes caeruleus]